MSDPIKPVGQSAAAQWIRDVHEKVYGHRRLGPVSGHRTANTTMGPMILPSKGGSGGRTPAEQFVIATPTEEMPIVDEDDYLVCRTYDGENTGEEDVFIAKSYKLRRSLTEITMLGTLYTCTYDADEDDLAEFPQSVLRTLTDPDDNTEIQRIVTPWTPGDIIYAIPATNTDVFIAAEEEDAPDVELEWIDVTGDRMWAKIRAA